MRTHHAKIIEQEKYKTRRELNRVDQECRQLVGGIEKGMDGIGKHDRIKVQSWLKKLEMKIDNLVWKSNRNFYLKVLSQMINAKTILEPFNKSPPQGPLPRLTAYDVPYPLRTKFLNQSEKEHKQIHGSSLENSFISTRKVSINELNNKQNISTENRLTGRGASKSIKKTDRSTRDDIRKTDRREKFDVSERYSFNNTNRRITFNEGIVELCSKVSSCSDDSKPQDRSLLRQTLTLDNNKPHSSSRQRCLPNSQSEQLLEAKTFMLLKRSFKFLMRNYDILQEQHEYTSIISDIIRLGDEKGVDLRSLNVDMTPSPSKIVFKKYSQRIKENFEKSGEETKQFMQYLSVLRNR